MRFSNTNYFTCCHNKESRLLPCLHFLLVLLYQLLQVNLFMFPGQDPVFLVGELTLNTRTLKHWKEKKIV